ncbi:hypothetical protein PUV54_14440 [Hyphococcus flavus]|uniref:DUF3035 domain-containing protein n=1 Tax=Hyphococcus flavus TaxID=1866326 RepID=A0AAE9ZHV0_9PROT|nr:hypothetical protein [Hyphococcus flavus]WDI31146.1 hypothetical protein PUV54_14440 [Hyphococcus flavus]
MSGVKQSSALFASLLAGFAVSGCANSELARFAPPGLVKVDRITDPEPVNPNVAARIAERKAEPGSGEFPVLSETPSANARPKKPSEASVEADLNALASARDTLESNMAKARAEAEAEAEDTRRLPERRDSLKVEVDKDAQAAALERREKLEAPPE